MKGGAIIVGKEQLRRENVDVGGKMRSKMRSFGDSNVAEWWNQKNMVYGLEVSRMESRLCALF